MKSVRELIEEAVSAALVKVAGPEGAEIDPVVRPTQDPRFGDYQSNVALGLKKRLEKNPRQIAEELVAALDLGGVCGPVEIAGPGFINFRVLPEFLASQLRSIQADPRLGVDRVENPRRVLVDYSGPNLAKEMHVGHLRSTVIGDAVARLIEFEGHEVLRRNHVGDWGTQIGMLIQYVRELRKDTPDLGNAFEISDLNSFYVAAKQRFDSDPEFMEAARRAVVDLQSGEPDARRLWTEWRRASVHHAEAVYQLLGVHPDLVERGESFYNDMLPEVVQELEEKGLAGENQGAVCVFLPGFENREGQPLPMIIRKSEGGYNYDTTDLAGIRYRVAEEGAERLIYVTDVRQKQHFDMVFAAARLAGWVPEDVSLEHLGYGMVLGTDRRPFRSRDGGTVKLVDLLQTAVEKARETIDSDTGRRADLSEEQKQQIAMAVGIGAVKYADLSHNPASDYVFDWDVMLAMDGNTAPYMLYAYARIHSIGRRAGVDFDALPADLPLVLEHESEIGLAKELLRFSAVVREVARDLKSNVLTDYLYSLSRAFSTFYDRERGVRVIDAEPEAVRLSRLRLCDLTARTLKLGLSLLGIQVVEQM